MKIALFALDAGRSGTGIAKALEGQLSRLFKDKRKTAWIV
jgi:hypothetical protein